MCLRSQRLCWHGVSVVNNYADTMSAWSPNTLTPCQHSQRHCVSAVKGQDNADTFGKLWRLLLLKGTIRQKRLLGCIYTSSSHNFKIWKSPYQTKKLRVRVVVDYEDTRISHFAIEYISKNDKVFETVFACSRSNLLSKNKWSKISWHCPFKRFIARYIDLYVLGWDDF